MRKFVSIMAMAFLLFGVGYVLAENPTPAPTPAAKETPFVKKAEPLPPGVKPVEVEPAKGSVEWVAAKTDDDKIMFTPRVFDMRANSITSVDLQPGEKRQFYVAAQDIDYMTITDIGDLEDGTLKRAGIVKMEDLKIEPQGDLKMRVIKEGTRVDVPSAYVRVTIELTAPEKEGVYELKMSFDDTVIKERNGDEKLWYPSGVKPAELKGTADDAPVTSTFKIKVSKAAAVALGKVVWSPTPADPDNGAMYVPQFREKKSLSIIKEVKGKVGRIITVVVSMQDFDKVQMIGCDKYPDAILDRPGSLSKTNIELIVPEALKSTMKKEKYDPGSAYFSAELEIELPDKPGEFEIVVKADDSVDTSNGKEVLPDPTGNGIVPEGSRNDQPAESKLKVIVVEEK